MISKVNVRKDKKNTMAHLFSLNVLLLPKDLTIIFYMQVMVLPSGNCNQQLSIIQCPTSCLRFRRCMDARMCVSKLWL